MSDTEEFYQKFEGYVIPKKKQEPVIEDEIKSIGEQNEIEVLPSSPSKAEKDKSSPKSKRRKVSKRSASRFLSESEDEAYNVPIPGLKDPLGLDKDFKASMTYGEARGARGALEAFQSLFEEPLPFVILSQCTELECKLCGLKFDGSSVAKSHYAGKNHMKRVKKALEEWHNQDPMNNKIPALKQQSEVTSSSQSEPWTFYENREDHDQTYCHICRIELSSRIVATSHYQGKNHAKELRKVQNGTYVPKDKIPFPTLPKRPKIANINKEIVLPDKESRQGSGNRFMCLQCKLHFRSNEEFMKHLTSMEHKEKAEGGVANNPKGRKSMEVLEFTTTPSQDSIDDMLSKLRSNPQSAFDCTLCQVQCSSQVTLATHLSGKQHLRKLEMSSRNDSMTGSAFKCEICNVETTDQNGLDMHVAGKKHQKKVNAMKSS